MKKIILIIITIILITNYSNAQEVNNSNESKIETRDKLHFGFKIGANLSNVYDTKGDAFNTDPKFGLAAGAFLLIPVGKYLGIQPELLFSQKGFQATGILLGNTYKLTRTTSYIDIPIFISFKPIEGLTILGGPQYSYLIRRNDVLTDAASNISIGQEQEFKNENIRKNILCFVGGLDLNLTHFVIGARVGWDVQKNNGDGTSTTPNYKNVWYQATLGYRLFSN